MLNELFGKFDQIAKVSQHFILSLCWFLQTLIAKLKYYSGDNIISWEVLYVFLLNLKLDGKSWPGSCTRKHSLLIKPWPRHLTSVEQDRSCTEWLPCEGMCTLISLVSDFWFILSSSSFLVGKRMYENQDPWRLLLLCVGAASLSTQTCQELR